MRGIVEELALAVRDVEVLVRRLEREKRERDERIVVLESALRDIAKADASVGISFARQRAISVLYGASEGGA